MQRDSTAKGLLENKKWYLAYQTGLENLIENEAPGICRDLMCYRLLLSLFKESPEGYQDLLDDQVTYIENQVLNELLVVKLEQYRNQEKIPISLLGDKDKEEE